MSYKSVKNVVRNCVFFLFGRYLKDVDSIDKRFFFDLVRIIRKKAPSTPNEKKNFHITGIICSLIEMI